VDEVLAVGDAAFQKKCMGKMSDISHEGRTVLFVSHNMGAITNLCENVLWLDSGHVRSIEKPDKCVQSYLASNILTTGAQVLFPDNKSKEAQLTCIELMNENNELTSEFNISSPVKVDIKFKCNRRILNLRVDLIISSYDGTPIFSTTSQDYYKIDHRFDVGDYNIQMIIPKQFLASGEYYITINLCEVNTKNFDFRESIMSFRIVGNPYQYERSIGSLIYPFEWKLI
jgi:lipopolysaccharide transport system ATP-binding protein